MSKTQALVSYKLRCAYVLHSLSSLIRLPNPDLYTVKLHNYKNLCRDVAYTPKVTKSIITDSFAMTITIIL